LLLVKKMLSAIGLYNRLAVTRETSHAQRASNDKVATGRKSGVKNCTNYKHQKAVMQAFNIVDCLAESHLFPFLVKVKIIYGKQS